MTLHTTTTTRQERRGKQRKAVKTDVRVYTREIDDGYGVQTVLVIDGVIVSQSIGPKEGLHHSYTGNGNPEFVGKPVQTLYGKGFTRHRYSQNTLGEIHESWLQTQTESDD